jgi:uncharacterized repeat protein (TIGR03806 family)
MTWLTAPELQAGTPTGRVVWQTSKVHGSPEPPLPYTTRRVFEKLEFELPTSMTHAPDTDRLYVTELQGAIRTFMNDRDASSTEVFLDLRKPGNDSLQANQKTRLWFIAFDPNFKDNGHVYVTYGQNNNPEVENRLSRFTVAPAQRANPVTCDRASEEVLLRWYGTGHNGGAVAFSPNDPYLYLTIGDGGAGNSYDAALTGQDVSDLRAGVVRIDPRQTQGDLPYAIPPDNPFVDLPGARPEVYSYGMRNPWRMSFDQRTGDLWVTDVGQNTWESVYRITPGSNFGWSINEGPSPFRPNRKRGPTPISPPTVAHARFESTSITGGYAYYGKRLPELTGHYVYGDYDSGKVWSFLYKDGQATEQREIADSENRIVSFGLDRQGELYLIDHQGVIEELVPTPPATTDTADFPRQLSQTGLFTDMKTLAPAPGVIPYSINAEPWYDGAKASRHFAIPSSEPLGYALSDIKDNYLFPPDTVLTQTLSLEMETGNAASAKRIETRLLHHSNNHWRFYSYVWNDEQTDATLVPKNGDAKLLSVTDAAAPGGKRDQIWAIPARSQCATCHVRVLDYAIGFKTPQLNRDHDYGDGPVSQLAVFDKMGLFGQNFRRAEGIKNKDFENATRLTDLRNASAPVADRARAYLHANCSHCHQPGGGGQATIDLRYHLTQNEMMTVDVTPAVGDFEIPGAKVVKPGDPAKSVLHHRMNLPFTGRMPLIGSFMVDKQGVELIEQWIRELK